MSDPNVVTPPAGSDTPAISAPAATPQVTPPVAATSATPQVPATGTPEDRSNWVPPFRLREVSQKFETAQQGWAAREAQYQAALTQRDNQLRALVGAAPPADPEVDEIRQRFSQVYPGLSRIEAKAEQLEQYLERIADMEAAVDYIWQNHSRQSLGRVFKHAEDTLGSPLTDEGKRALQAAFAGWVQSNPEYQQRYVDDPTIVDEFWKTLSSTLVDPARRASAAAAVARVPQGLPQDRPAGAPPVSQPPKLSGLDERASAAWALYNQSKG